MNLSDWVYNFMHGIRYVAEKTTAHDKQFIADYLREYALAKPCQAEVVSFKNPYRLLLLFFLDESKQDFIIRLHTADWRFTNQLIANLENKYKPLKINHSELLKMFSQCKNCSNNIMYGIDLSRNLCAIYFTDDPRKSRTPPSPYGLNSSKPQDVAEMVFRLNVDQASSYSIDKL